MIDYKINDVIYNRVIKEFEIITRISFEYKQVYTISKKTKERGYYPFSWFPELGGGWFKKTNNRIMKILYGV